MSHSVVGFYYKMCTTALLRSLLDTLATLVSHKTFCTFQLHKKCALLNQRRMVPHSVMGFYYKTNKQEQEKCNSKIDVKGSEIYEGSVLTTITYFTHISGLFWTSGHFWTSGLVYILNKLASLEATLVRNCAHLPTR